MELFIILSDFLKPLIAQNGLAVLALTAMLYLLKKNMHQSEENNQKIQSALKRQDESLEKLRKDMDEGFREQREMIQQLQAESKETKLMTLRGLITNSSLPKSYRMGAYDQYKESGGNSWVDKYVENELLKEQD